MTATGWLPDEVRRLDGDDVGDLLAHWRKVPPEHVSADRAARATMAAFGVAEARLPESAPARDPYAPVGEGRALAGPAPSVEQYAAAVARLNAMPMARR